MLRVAAGIAYEQGIKRKGKHNRPVLYFPHCRLQGGGGDGCNDVRLIGKRGINHAVEHGNFTLRVQPAQCEIPAFMQTGLIEPSACPCASLQWPGRQNNSIRARRIFRQMPWREYGWLFRKTQAKLAGQSRVQRHPAQHVSGGMLPGGSLFRTLKAAQPLPSRLHRSRSQQQPGRRSRAFQCHYKSGAGQRPATLRPRRFPKEPCCHD